MANLEIEILQAWKGGKTLKLKAYPDNPRRRGSSSRRFLKGMDGEERKGG